MTRVESLPVVQQAEQVVRRTASVVEQQQTVQEVTVFEPKRGEYNWLAEPENVQFALHAINQSFNG